MWHLKWQSPGPTLQLYSTCLEYSVRGSHAATTQSASQNTAMVPETIIPLTARNCLCLMTPD